MLAAPGQQVVLDAAAGQVVEHLVGGTSLAARQRDELLHVATSKLLTPQWRILPVALQLVEGVERLLERHAAPPVQQVQVEPVGAEPLQAALAGGDRPAPRGVLGRTLLTRKTSSRRPAIASPTSSSAPPSPYISAVSISVMPRSSPSRRAAISSAAAVRSSPMCQVPWPEDRHGLARGQ